MKTSSSVRSVVHCLSSLLYISHVIWFCIINFRVKLFIGTIVPELMDIYPDDNGKGIGTGKLILRQDWCWDKVNFHQGVVNILSSLLETSAVVTSNHSTVFTHWSEVGFKPRSILHCHTSFFNFWLPRSWQSKISQSARKRFICLLCTT